MLRKFLSQFSSTKAPVRCIGTYHKTGTVWLLNVFSDIANDLGVTLINMPREETPSGALQNGTFYFQEQSLFASSFYQTDARGIRIIRDPRDVVISGARYHCKSEEAWLHVPQELFGGHSYHEEINAQPTLTDQLRFEMRNTGNTTIRQMVHANADTERHAFIQKHFLTVRYEDLINDTELKVVKQICKHLQIPFKIAAPHFQRHALFGNGSYKSAHVRSGKAEQWKSIFDRKLAEDFAAMHQPALEALRYETDDTWVSQLP